MPQNYLEIVFKIPPITPGVGYGSYGVFLLEEINRKPVENVHMICPPRIATVFNQEIFYVQRNGGFFEDILPCEKLNQKLIYAVEDAFSVCKCIYNAMYDYLDPVNLLEMSLYDQTALFVMLDYYKLSLFVINQMAANILPQWAKIHKRALLLSPPAWNNICQPREIIHKAKEILQDCKGIIPEEEDFEYVVFSSFLDRKIKIVWEEDWLAVSLDGVAGTINTFRHLCMSTKNVIIIVYSKKVKKLWFTNGGWHVQPVSAVIAELQRTNNTPYGSHPFIGIVERRFNTCFIPEDNTTIEVRIQWVGSNAWLYGELVLSSNGRCECIVSTIVPDKANEMYIQTIPILPGICIYDQNNNGKILHREKEENSGMAGYDTIIPIEFVPGETIGNILTLKSPQTGRCVFEASCRSLQPFKTRHIPCSNEKEYFQYSGSVILKFTCEILEIVK